MTTSEVWRYIGSERSAMADTWEIAHARTVGLPSWCEGWTVRKVAGHVLAAAEQTPPNFFKEFASAGFSSTSLPAAGREIGWAHSRRKNSYGDCALEPRPPIIRPVPSRRCSARSSCTATTCAAPWVCSRLARSRPGHRGRCVEEDEHLSDPSGELRVCVCGHGRRVDVRRRPRGRRTPAVACRGHDRTTPGDG